MGSGHILVYAFDVLMQMYVEFGYSEREAAKSIVENNLYGLDIDNRAGQLAYFAVMMKARKYNRRILNVETKPNVMAIQESNSINPDYLSLFGDLESKARELLENMKDAKDLGSIIRVKLTVEELTELKNKAEEIENSFYDNFFDKARQSGIATEFIPLIEQAIILAQKYEVVVTNPPYMGSSGMNDKLAKYVKKNFPDSKSDLFSCLMECADSFVNDDGYTSLITMESWMFLSSFEKLRNKVNTTKTIINMIHMPYLGKGGTSLGINFGTAAVIMKKGHIINYSAQYEYTVYYECDVEGVPVVFPTINERWKTAKQENFSKIPGSPVAYWVSNNFIQNFAEKAFSDVVDSRVGLDTGDNNRFLRLWFEPNVQKIKFDANSIEQLHNSVGKKYSPHTKGGEYRKWYGNYEYVILFDPLNYSLLLESGNHLPSRQFYFLEGMNWTRVSSSFFAVRISPVGSVFNSACPTVFVEREKENYTIALLNSHVVRLYLNLLSPTINFQAGDIGKVPYVYDKSSQSNVDSIAESAIVISKKDWDSYETSWDFKRNPLV